MTPFLMAFCWVLCVLCASCLSLPGRSVVPRWWDQGAPVLDSPAHGSATLALPLRSFWGILHSFGFRNSPALCWAAARHGSEILLVLSRTLRLAGQNSSVWGWVQASCSVDMACGMCHAAWQQRVTARTVTGT